MSCSYLSTHTTKSDAKTQLCLDLREKIYNKNMRTTTEMGHTVLHSTQVSSNSVKPNQTDIGCNTIYLISEQHHHIRHEGLARLCR